MELKSTRAFKIIRERREIFEEALRILLGETYEKTFESWRATRRLAVIVHAWEDAFDGSNPPRAAHAIKLLVEIEDDSRALRQRLQQFDDQLLIYAKSVIPSSLFDAQSRKIIDESELFRAGTDSELSPSMLNRRLLALEAGCRTLSGFFPADRGGRTNLETELLGNAKNRLAYDAGQLFVEFRPGIISSNPKKPFYKFVGALYEVLTGQEPEGAGAGLKKYAEFVALQMRKVEKIRTRLNELMFERVKRRLNADEEQELARLQMDSQALHDELLMGPPSGRNAP